MTKRRDLILTGLALAGVAAGWQAWIRRPLPLAFQEVSSLPGWRFLETGQLSTTGDASFLTIGQSSDAVAPLPADALDAVLYPRAGTPPIAVFSDFFCPFCRALTASLSERNDLTLNWHELPLLGPSSKIAARATIAADLQGGYAEFVAALSSSGFRPTERHMASVASNSGLNPEQLVQDMNGQAVATRLAASRRAAATLGIVGTPGMTIGRTIVVGEISTHEIDMLVRAET